MASSAPLLERTWTCLGQPSDDAAASTGRPGLNGGNTLFRTTSFVRGEDERDFISAQASSDQVCILSRAHDFVQALPFWQAFSSSEETERVVTCVFVGPDAEANETLVAAAMDHRIAIWAASSSSSRRWRVHSTVMVGDGRVTSIDVQGGRLLIGTDVSVSLWQLDRSSIGIWRRTWRAPCPAPIRIARLSPDGGSIAAATEGGQNILLWTIPPKEGKAPVLSQRIFHPYPILSFTWRHPPEPSSQCDVLVSYSCDGVARIWASVIDEPSKLRLWTTLDAGSDAGKQPLNRSTSPPLARPFYLEACVVASALRSNIGALERELQMIELGVGTDASSDKAEIEQASDTKRTRLRRLQQLLSEAPDMFLRLEDDGFLTILAVANIDRRPPTLLQTLTVLKVPIALPIELDEVADIALLPRFAGTSASSDEVFAVLQIQHISGAITTVGVNPASFFDGRGAGLSRDGADLSNRANGFKPGQQRPLVAAHRSRIASLQRSSDGSLLAASSPRDVIVWKSSSADSADASASSGMHPVLVAERRGVARLTALSGDGKLHASVIDDELQIRDLTLSNCDAPWRSEPIVQAINLIGFAEVDAARFVFALSSDGISTVWRLEEAQPLRATQMPGPSLALQDRRVSIAAAVTGMQKASSGGAVAVTVSMDGLLERWALRTLAKSSLAASPSPSGLFWHRESAMQTDVRDIVLISSSSSGQNAIVSRTTDGGQRLSIYNSKASSFASGLEHEVVYPADDLITALDWAPSRGTEPLVAVAFEHRVEILGHSRQRLYKAALDVAAGSRNRWSAVLRIDMSSETSSKIRGMAWVAGDRLAIASASSLFVYGPTIVPAQSGGRRCHLAEVLAEEMGPLPQYHPTFLQECLLWSKLDAAKAIILNLKRALAAASPGAIEDTWEFRDIGLESFASENTAGIGNSSIKANGHGRTKQQGRSIFDEDSDDSDSSDDELNARTIEVLLRALESTRIPHLSELDAKALGVIVRTVGEAEQQRRSLDDNGLRFLMSLRLLLNRPENCSLDGGAVSGELSYQDVVWAFHSDNQESLVAAVTTGCRNKLTWANARATGVFMWLKNHTLLRDQAEQMARAQFMVGDDRDPVKCSLIYFALGKPKVVLGLWKQAVWHPEQKKMLQFLSKDFSEERWRTAAQKNAFALLSQRRYDFAASFFMLGDSLQDAVNVCVRNLDDLGLAIAVARIREGSDDGPVLRNLLLTKVLPQAFEKGQRWLATWAFWVLKRRDLAVRVLVSPLSELLADPDVATMLPKDTKCGDVSGDDASLAILFKQLKNKSLQTLRGTAAISERKEFDFILHTNRVLCRSGCHILGLDLLRTWEFAPPVVASSTTAYHAISQQDLATISRIDVDLKDESQGIPPNPAGRTQTGDAVAPDARERPLRRRDSHASISPPSSPTISRRRSTMLRRRSSILNDLDIGSILPAAAAAGSAAQSPPHSRHTQQQSTSTTTSSSSEGAMGRREPSAPAGTSTIFHRFPSEEGRQDQRAARLAITEEPEALDGGEDGDGAAKNSDRVEPAAQATAPADAQVEALASVAAKPKGLGVFKSAAASNAHQGAQEFDFGRFGF